MRVALVLLLLAPALVADERRGLLAAREARSALLAGDLEDAEDAARRARTELPGSPLVTHTLADVLSRAGRYAEAYAEYEKARGGELGRRAVFNTAVTRARQAEEGLEAAGVPADADALPDPAPPELVQAIEDGLPKLERARDEFLEAFDQRPDAASRESIAALGRRIDELREMLEELRDQQEQQDQERQQEDQDQQQDGEDQQDQPPQDRDGEQDPEQDEDRPQDQPAGEPDRPPEPRHVSPEQLQRLMERLEDLEEQQREIEAARRAAARREVEKDW